jgi:hypothetical protein
MRTQENTRGAHERYDTGPGGCAENGSNHRFETAVARTLRHRAPPYNRRFLESRLAYRIQKLAYGGLKPETVERLEALAEGLDGNNALMRQRRGMSRPLAGTVLVREWQGVEHRTTVLNDGYEYQGRPHKSLSAVARAITGTRWNGLVFFGLKSQRAPR